MELGQFVEKHKNKLFNINIIIIILSLIIANNIYKHQDKNAKSLKEKINIEAEKNKVLEELSKTERMANSYRSLLVDKNVNEIINTLNNIARESGIEIVAIKPAREERRAEYIKRLFDLQIKARDYHSLGSFISRVESHQDVYMVESLSMKSETDTEASTISLRISSVAHAL